MFADLTIWLNHFEYHAAKPRRLSAEASDVLTGEERAAIAESLAAFRLGGERATQLLGAAERFAAAHACPQLTRIVSLLIHEEERHAALLGAFLEAHGLPRRRPGALRRLFGRLRWRATFGPALALLLAADLIGIVYYRALETATRCERLRALSRMVLADEHAHVGFESALFLQLRSARTGARGALERGAHRALFTAMALAAWLRHGRLLRRAGYGPASFVTACRAQYEFYLEPAALLGVELRKRAEARTQTAKSCAAMSRKDLNSSALPEGSSRNMVACSPGAPLKRT
jgi:hypothetical protein